MASRILIAYFSWSGNTETLARQIHERIGGDLFEIKTVDPYPTDYNACVKQAKSEQKAAARPVLTGTVPDMARYDVVLLGYPNWWSSVPMPVCTFLEVHDFHGKIVFPFCTHGGGGSGHSFQDIAELIPDADVGEGFSLSDAHTSAPQPGLDRWLRERGFIHETRTMCAQGKRGMALSMNRLFCCGRHA